MPELAVGYIKLTTDASGIPREINAALKGVDAQASAAGKSMGGKMSSALGGALKAGAATAAAAGVATIGTAMVKGFSRLNAIDQAKAKLGALGNSAADVSKIMDNALASVKGTAFGLGDAAGLAGTMVAAGVKPGKELESVLKTVADTAAVAGTDLGEMGAIWGKAAAQGKVDGEVMAQLMDRQIGLLPALAKHYNVTTDAAKKMVSDGKVSFKDFTAVMQDMVGGGAVKMGQTVQGAFQNMGAALGRVGASALDPFFNRAGGGLGNITTLLDNLEPKVKAFSAALADKAFNEWGPKLQAAFQAARDSQSFDELLSTLKAMAQAGIDVGPALRDIGQALAQASAAIGFGTWQLFVTTLQAATGVLNILNPALKFLGDLMKNHSVLVTAALAAWLGFKTVPGMLSKVTDVMSPLTSRVTSVRDVFKGFGDQMVLQRTLAANNGVELGRLGGAMAVVRTRASGMRQAMKGALDVFGGPWGAAVTGVTVGAGLLIASFQRQNAIFAEQDAAAKKLTESYYDLGKAMLESHGEATSEVLAIGTKRIDEYREGVDAAARADGKWHEVMYDGLTAITRLGSGQKGLAAMNDEAAGKAQQAQKAFDKLGMSTEDVGKAVYGSSSQWGYLTMRLNGMGQSGQQVRKDLQGLRNDFLQQQGLAKSLTPGIVEVTDAIKTLGDDSATSATKMSALKTAMQALNPTRNEAEAMKQWGEQVRAATDAAAGIDGTAFNLKGELDSSTEAGGKLLGVLSGLADTAANVAASGGDMTKVAAEQDRIFAQLAASTGKTKEEIKAIYDSIGGNVVDIAVALKGAPEAIQQLGGIKAAMDANPKLTEYTLKAEGSEAVQAALRNIGIEFKKTPDGKAIKVDLTGDAGKKLQDVIQAASQVPPGKEIRVNAPGGEGVYNLLKAMGVEVRTNNDKTISADIPGGSPVLQMLRDIGYEVETRNGKTIIVKADDTDYQAKKPEWTSDLYKRLYVNPILASNPNALPMGPGIGPGYSSGGYTGPGSKYQPAGIVHADEFVIKKSSRQKLEAAHPGALDAMNATGRMPGYAEGGRVSAEDLRRLADGEGASQPLKGAPYVWGGINWGDCSAAMSAFARRAVGLDPFGGRFTTSSMGGQLAQMGFQNGSWSQGSLGFGWVNGGPGGGHTAGTLPDGTNVEMGGSYGGGMVGGSVGANSGQFTNRMFLPVDASATSVDPYQRPGDEYSADPNYRPGQNGTTGDTSKPTGGVKGILQKFASDVTGAAYSGMWQFLGVDEPWWMQMDMPDLKAQKPGGPTQQQKPSTPTDPGVTKPKEGEDTGNAGNKTGVEAVKTMFQEGLRLMWRTGPEWDATDYIIDKESSWNKDARNGKYFGLGQLGPDAWKAAGIAETADPTQQGRAFDHYVDGRYKSPTKAKEFRDANNWYDRGGVADGIGLMLKRTIKPERVLSPSQTAAFEQGMRRGFGGDTKALEAKFDELIGKLDGRGGDTWQVTVADQEAFFREKQTRDRMAAMTYGG